MYPCVNTRECGFRLTFPVLICVLEGLDQPQSLIHRAAHRQIIDGDLAKDTLAIDDKEAPEIAEFTVRSQSSHCQDPGREHRLPASHRAGGREGITQERSPHSEDGGFLRVPQYL